MKKIVFIIESLDLGGSEKCLISLLKNFDYSKYKVDLIIFKDNGIFRNFVPEEVNVIVEKWPSLSLIERFRFKALRILNKNKYHSAQLLWRIIENKFHATSSYYDVAFAYSQGFTTYFTERYIISGKKYSWINTDYKKAGYNIDFDYPIYISFNKIIAVSHEAKKALDDELNLVKKSLIVDVIIDIFDNVVEKSLENKKRDFNPDKINIVTVCRLAKEKGLHLAIESCKILVEKGHDINWYVVGEGNERKYLEKLIKAFQIENSFFLIGATDNPYPYMKDCDIFVQTSLFEGGGTTLNEVSLLNKPIVCTNFPSAFEILKNGETGLIAEMNVESIVSKIQMFLNNDDLKNMMIDNLSKLEKPDKEQTLLKFEELIHGTVLK